MFQSTPDIRKTTLKEFFVGLAVDKLDDFTAEQKVLWDKFYINKNSDKILQKADIDPIRLKHFLPNVWMADLMFDERSALIDIEVRLMGTKVANIFGERTGEHVLSENDPTGFVQELNISNQQIIDVANVLLHEKQPIFSLEIRTSTTSNEKLKATALIFPVYNNSDTINMAFGHTEVEVI